MTGYVPADLRRLVQSRANRRCEYCLISDSDTWFGCQVDHIIAEKHGGATIAENLSYACTMCNRAKGSDIGSISKESGEFVRFFNPRTDKWRNHFELRGFVIETRTQIGEVTARILRFNDSERLMERKALAQVGRYPLMEETN